MCRCWLAGFALLLALSPASADEAGPKITADVVYGRKDGMALTFDVIRPAKPNGAAVIYIPTGGWYCQWIDPKAMAVISTPFLDKGFTVIALRHGCAPKYNIPECVEDLRRGIRFIRAKSKDYGVDADRLGVWGASAGGHLSLVLGTTGDEGDAKSKDPLAKTSSRVAAVVALCPPTDIRPWVGKDDAPLFKRLPQVKPPLTFDPKRAPDYSPALKVTEKCAPTLLIHGDKDDLVTFDHSEKMLAAMEKAKVTCKLINVEGAGHAFTPAQNKELVIPGMVAWFEKHLAKK